MSKLKKEQVAEYLRTYFLFIEKSRLNLKKTLKENFVELVSNFCPYNELKKYYVEMINTYTTCNLINAIGLINDETHGFMKRDKDINEKLNFLNHCFINGSTPQDFNKIDVFVYIRNAFFHSEINELYSINSDGTVNIHMPSKKLYLKLTQKELMQLNNVIANNVNRNIVFKIVEQSNIDMNEILADRKRCINELQKIRIRRIQNKGKSTNSRIDIINKLPKEKNLNDIDDFLSYVVDKTKTIENFEFSLSHEQCESLAYQIGVYKKYKIPIDLFLTSLISNNLEFGINKIDATIFNYLISTEFLYNWNNTVWQINDRLTREFMDLIYKKSVTNSNFFKRKYHNYGTLNGDVYKKIYIYLLENYQFPYHELNTYLSYVFSNIGCFETESKESKIRNALTHKRFFWSKCINVKESKICLYDNINDIRKPVSYDDSLWHKKINILEIINMADIIVKKYCKKNNQGIMFR